MVQESRGETERRGWRSGGQPTTPAGALRGQPLLASSAQNVVRTFGDTLLSGCHNSVNYHHTTDGSLKPDIISILLVVPRPQRLSQSITTAKPPSSSAPDVPRPQISRSTTLPGASSTLLPTAQTEVDSWLCEEGPWQEYYNGTVTNIVDNPGYADSGGQVKRVLSAVAGPALATQTTFVEEDALTQGPK